MTKSALNSDLAVSARAAGAAAPAAEQLDFLAPVAERISSIDPEAIAANAADERKRGRPKGAENLSSRQLREMLVRAGGHPLIHLARWATLTPEELAKRLGCSVVEAFDRQVAIWDKLAPYVAAKLAPTDEKGNAVPGLVISRWHRSGRWIMSRIWKQDQRVAKAPTGVAPTCRRTSAQGHSASDRGAYPPLSAAPPPPGRARPRFCLPPCCDFSTPSMIAGARENEIGAEIRAGGSQGAGSPAPWLRAAGS